MPRPLAPSRAIDGAIGPFDDYCNGYGNPGSSGVDYVSVLKLSTGTVAQNTDANLEEIVSRNRAEKSDAYVGQINTITASSFSWLNGAVWGYDLARHDGLINGSIKPLMKRQRRDGTWIPVYPVTPLLEAGEALFGTSGSQRFPLMPGSHVICATKDIVANGPTTVWSAIALAIAEDRGQSSSLFVEDVGQGAVDESREEQESLLHQFHRLDNIVDSIILCGDDQNVRFKEIFVGFKSEWVPKGQVGCALTCVPYLVLAKNAVPSPASDLLDMSLSDWESYVGPGLLKRGSDR